jgi:glycosyltransferase involved in cell wall biosynthesis
MGGGVGTVLRSYFAFESKKLEERVHTVCSLEELDGQSKTHLASVGIRHADKMYQDLATVSQMIDNSDIVLIHWWNHPLLQDLLLNQQMPPSRILLWCHISGLQSPNVISKYILDFPDEFIFTTPLSRQVPCVMSYRESNKSEFDTIWSTCGYESIIEKCQPPKSKNHSASKKTRLGYVGNLDQTKVSEDFFQILRLLDPSTYEITIIGPRTRFFDDMTTKYKMQNLSYLGYVSEDEKFHHLNNFDIFFYPLARNHYGTCDQALQEAMTLGIPAVAFNNPMESYMIDHGVTGLIAKNTNEFAQHISLIGSNNNLYRELSIQSRAKARREYSMAFMAGRWEEKFSSCLEKPKNEKKSMSAILGRTLKKSEVMAASLGIYGGVFWQALQATDLYTKSKLESQIATLSSSLNWTSPSKSSVHHYAKFFDDPDIARWSDLTA